MENLERLSTLTAQQRSNHSLHDLVRWLSCVAYPGGGTPLERFQQKYPRAINKGAVESAAAAWPNLMTKAAVLPGSTTDVSWAGALAQPSLFDGFVAAIREQSVLASLPYTPCLFQQNIPKRMTGASIAWVGQGVPKKAAKFAFTSTVLAPTKAAGIVALSGELLKFMPPGAERMISQSLVSDVVAFTDAWLLSPTAGVAGVSPAGILNGVTPITPGTTPDNSLTKLIAALFAAVPNAREPRIIMSPASASQFSALRTTPGPGVPRVVLTPDAGVHVIALDVAMLCVADGGAVVDVNTDADVILDDAPVVNAAAVLTSLWQTNGVGFRTERAIGWDASGAGVQYFDLAAPTS